MRTRLLLLSSLLAGYLSPLAAQPLPTPPESMKLEAAAPVTWGPISVEDEFATAKARAQSEATELLKQRDYPGLNAMAATLRNSQESFAQGEWPIGLFFNALKGLPRGSSSAMWTAQMDALRDWFENDPDSVNARVAYAQGLVEYAWEARGAGYASSVTSAGWQAFGERLTEARRVLIAAESLAPKCPVLHLTRLRVALGDGTGRMEYDGLFEAAIAAFPTYPQLYLARANYLLPRWHGEEGEWEAFAKASADRLGNEAGAMLYAQIVWRLHDIRIYGNIMKETAVEWPRTQRGFDALCRRYPNSISAPSEYCYLAGFAPEGGRQLTRLLFPRLGDRVDLSVWKTMDRWIQDRQWAFAEN